METRKDVLTLGELAKRALGVLNTRSAEVDEKFRTGKAHRVYFMTVRGDDTDWAFIYDKKKRAVTMARRTGIAPYPIIAVEREWNGYRLLRYWQGEEQRD